MQLKWLIKGKINLGHNCCPQDHLRVSGLIIKLHKLELWKNSDRSPGGVKH